MAARAPNPIEQMNRILSDLKGGKLASVYLLHGDSPLLKRECIKAVELTSLDGGPSSFNVHRFDGAQAQDTEQALDACNTLPMMAKRRVVHVENAHKIDKGRVDALTAYLESPSPSGTLILHTASVLKGTSKLVKACQKAGENLSFRALYEREIPDFIRAEAKRLGKRMDGRGVRYLQEMVGTDLGELRTQLEKISIFVGDKERIEVGDLEGVVSDINLDTIFAFNDAVGSGKVGQALLNLTRMFEASESPIRLLAMLHRHFRQLVAAHQLIVERKIDPEDAAADLGVYGNRVYMWKRNFVPQVKGWKKQPLHKALTLIQGTHLQLREPSVPQAMRLEYLILRLGELHRVRF